jgi:catechol 2,3-dioxygenase
VSLIRQMGYVVLAVPDPAGGADDLADIVGAEIVERHADGIYLSTNSRRCEVAYLKGIEAGVRAVGLEATDTEAVAQIEKRAKADGLMILDDRPLVRGVERAVRFATPMGPIFEVHTPVQRRDTGPALMTDRRRVKRLEHVNLRTSDPQAFHDLVTQLLGLKLSDRTTNFERAWYRALDGFHHTLAAGSGQGIHHYAFDAFALDDLVEVAGLRQQCIGLVGFSAARGLRKRAHPICRMMAVSNVLGLIDLAGDF